MAIIEDESGEGIEDEAGELILDEAGWEGEFIGMSSLGMQMTIN